MIERYSRQVMRDIWTEENKFNAYLKVEILNAEAWSKIFKNIPESDVKLLWDNAKFDINRIKEIEAKTRHDVVAFTRAVGETLGEEKKWVHYGLTSTDVVDTANGYLMTQANKILREDLVEFMAVLKKQALRFKKTPCIGRTHGIHADITSFGLKWALWYEEMKRNLERWGNMSYSTWEKHIDDLRAFARKRNKAVIQDAKQYFGLTDSEVKKYFGDVV